MVMVPKQYDFWLLDLDGTLVDIEPSYIHQVFEEVGDRLGREFSDREAELIWHGLGGSRNKQLREWNIDVESFWNTFHDVEDAQTRAEHTYLYDDASFVGELAEPVGLVTHCQQYLTDPVLDRLDIRDWFDTVVCCTEDIGWKPDPTPVEIAMRDLGVTNRAGTTTTTKAKAKTKTKTTASSAQNSNKHAASGVLAGDGPHDIGAAWNAGLDGIHIERHGPSRRGQCVLGDYRVESFDELGSVTNRQHSD